MYYIKIAILIFLILAILFYLISTFVSMFASAPFVDSNSSLIKDILYFAKPQKDDYFYDLGCGSAKIVKVFADNHVKHAYGYEISPLAYLIAKIRLSKTKNASVAYENFYKIDYNKPDIIYCYLLPKAIQKLSKIFEKKLKPKTRVICQDFPIKSKIPEKIKKVGRHTLYLYIY